MRNLSNQLFPASESVAERHEREAFQNGLRLGLTVAAIAAVLSFLVGYWATGHEKPKKEIPFYLK